MRLSVSSKWLSQLLMYYYIWQEKYENLKRLPSTIDDLKYCLGEIAEIRRNTVENEYNIRIMEEMYRTLLSYGHEVGSLELYGTLCVCMAYVQLDV